MKKLLAIALCAPLLAHAAQWAKVAASGAVESYVDKSSMMKSGSGWKAWSMTSYGAPQTTVDGTAYRSVKTFNLYSCAERTSTLLSQVFYAEPMGKGAVVQSMKFEKFNPDDIVPDSAEDGALQLICRGKK